MTYYVTKDASAGHKTVWPGKCYPLLRDNPAFSDIRQFKTRKEATAYKLAGDPLSKSELNTILGALRLLQRAHIVPSMLDSVLNDGDVEPLDNAAIDDMCEAINCGDLQWKS